METLTTKTEAKPMITVSESASKQISELMTQQNLAKDYFLRVRVLTGGCSGLSYSMEFTNKSETDDQVFEDRGVKIVTDFKSILYLHGTELDFSEGLNGKGFLFNNPNATRTCGCGESFSV